MTLVVLGLRPSLHAAARKAEHLPVSLAALHGKVNRTEPGVLRALVQGSAARLEPVAAAIGSGAASLPGWRVRIMDGDHLPASEKRLGPLRGFRGAALPGQSVVVYDPDAGLVTDMAAQEDAHESGRTGAAALLDGAGPGQVRAADRHFCTRMVMGGWQGAGAGFVVREHGRTETGTVREQAITLEDQPGTPPWRRIELTLDQPTANGDATIRLWGNLPEEIDAGRIAALCRTRVRHHAHRRRPCEVDPSCWFSRILRGL